MLALRAEAGPRRPLTTMTARGRECMKVPMHAFRVAAGVLLLSSVIAGSPVAQAAPASGEQTYIVLYNQSAVPADATSRISAAGGSLVFAYDQIGVAIA